MIIVFWMLCTLMQVSQVYREREPKVFSINK